MSQLENSREQTFYHLLVDAKDWEASWERPPVAYVAEELLQAPEVQIASVVPGNKHLTLLHQALIMVLLCHCFLIHCLALSLCVGAQLSVM